MIDEDKGRREAQDRTHSKGQAKQRPLLFTASGNAIYERETEGYSDSHQRNSPQFTWKRIKRWFKRRDSAFWQAAFTGLTVAGLIGYTWYTRQQWITLNKSVTDSATQFEKTLSQMRAQTGIQQNTLNQTIVATRTDQRAWLAIMGIGPAVVDPKASVPVQVTVMYFNSGRTPARNIKHEVTGFIVGNPIYKLPEPLVYKTTGTPGDIFPFATGTASALARNDPPLLIRSDPPTCWLSPC